MIYTFEGHYFIVGMRVLDSSHRLCRMTFLLLDLYFILHQILKDGRLLRNRLVHLYKGAQGMYMFV